MKTHKTSGSQRPNFRRHLPTAQQCKEREVSASSNGGLLVCMYRDMHSELQSVAEQTAAAAIEKENNPCANTFQPVCSSLEVSEEAALVAKECLMVYDKADLDGIWYVTLRPNASGEGKRDA